MASKLKTRQRLLKYWYKLGQKKLKRRRLFKERGYIRRIKEKLFTLESMEPRVLLSGDNPVGVAHAALLRDVMEAETDALDIQGFEISNGDEGEGTSREKKIEAKEGYALEDLAEGQEIPDDDGSILYNLADIKTENIVSEESLNVVIGDVLGGSGEVELDVYNEGVVSPGYSPGVQSFNSFTQNSNGVLEIEIGGTNAGTEYDQVQVSGLADLDGTLSVSLINDFRPSDGDTFDILTYGSVDGNFAEGEGLFIDSEGLWFEVVEQADKIQLVTHEILPEESKLVFEPSIDTSSNDIGDWLNSDYFGVPDHLSFEGEVSLGDNFTLAGDIQLRQISDNYSLDLEGGTSANVFAYSLGIEDGTLLLGNDSGGSDFGLSFTDVDLGIAWFDPTNDSDDRSWIAGKGNLGSASFSGGDNISLSATNMTFDLNLGFGGTGLVADFSTNNIEVLNGSLNTVATLDYDGDEGTRLVASGSASLDVGPFSLSGDVWFSHVDGEVEAAGENITADLEVGGLSASVTNASFGLILNDDGMALEASGGFSTALGGLATIGADTAKVRYNDTGTDFSNHEITIGDKTYTFGTLEAEEGIQEIAVDGASLEIGGFVAFSGDMAFQADKAEITLSDGNIEEVDLLTLGGKNLSGFVGMDAGGDNAKGFSVTGTDFALALLDENDGDRKWSALQAEIGGHGIQGIDGLTLSSSDLYVAYNQAASDGTLVDFDDSPVTVLTGASSAITFDMDSDLGELKRLGGTMEIGLFDSVNLSGSYAFEQSESTFTLDDESEVGVELLTLGADNASAFFGIHGGTDDAQGFELEGLNFALLMAKEKEGDERQWTAFQGGADGVGLTGLEDVLTLEASNLGLVMNQAAEDGSLIDFGTNILM